MNRQQVRENYKIEGRIGSIKYSRLMKGLPVIKGTDLRMRLEFGTVEAYELATECLDSICLEIVQMKARIRDLEKKKKLVQGTL